MWRVILLVFCYHVVSQPVADVPSTRHTRELIECCPCPGSTVRSQLGRAIDDCPCRLRDVDSEGSSSMLFPSRNEAGRSSNFVPFMRSNDPKDDMKNLLEPEVGLATSMLQTLREATEEEYRDAVARDAARSSDTIPEESARNVVIIVKPRASNDDVDLVSEASNVKETRCIQPIGSSLGRMRSVSTPLRTLPDLFKIPQARQPVMHRNLWDLDSNVGASNAQESIVEMNGGAVEKPLPPLFKLRTPLKENPLKSSMNGEGLRTPSIFEKLEQSSKNRPNLFERLNLPLIPKKKLGNPLRTVGNNINTNSDLSPAKSNVHELIENEDSKGNGVFNKRPLMLKNLLKLKDVELIPKTTPKSPLFNSKVNDNYVSQSRLLNTKAHENCEDSTFEAQNVNNDFKNIGKNVAESDEDNQDAITSPTEIIPIVKENTQTNTVDSEEMDCTNELSEEIVTSNSGIISKTLQKDNNSNEVLDPTQLSEIENITEKDTNISKGFKTEVSENANDNLDIDGSYNIENMIPFTSRDNEYSISQSEFQEPGHEIINPLDNVDEDFMQVRISENESQSGKPSSLVISNNHPKIKPIPLSETMSTIKDNVHKSFEKFMTTSRGSSAKLQERNSNTLITDDQEPRRDESVEETDDSKTLDKGDLDQVTFKDLQQQSDDLLVLSSNKEQNITPEVTNVEDELNESDFKSNAAKEQTEEVESESFEDEPTTLLGKKTPKVARDKLKKEKACHIGFDEIKKTVLQPKSVHQDENIKDMSVEASALTASILPALNLNEQLGSSLFQNIDPLDPLNLNENLGSPLLPNINLQNLSDELRSSVFKIVQPTIPDDPLISLRKPIAEIFKLPTLEDLKQRLSSVFDNNERSAENNFSAEGGNCPNDAPEMVSAASINSLQKNIRPLEDLNVDIFQLNPLSSSQPDLLSKVPRLNLNNFRTKLPIPTNLDLKPVKLESRLGNNKGNVIGASMTFGNDRATSRKAKPINSNLGHPLGSLPSLNELRNTLHSGTQNLLGTPLQPRLDLFRDSNLRSSDIPDIDEIRRNAEKTMKSLQQKMKSTFKGGRINNPLIEKFARPEDLLEDVNDKLKAIHYDLNDRLSSIHDDFLDQSKLKPLAIPTRIPTFSSFLTNINPNRNIMNTIKKTKGKPARLQTSASTISSQEIDPSENINNRIFYQSESRNGLKRVQTKPHTLAGAESSPVPTKIEFPKSKTTVDIPSKSLSPTLSQRLPTFRQGPENILSKRIRGKPLNLPRKTSFVKDVKSPILGKSNPFKDNTRKVSITFATTTSSPVTPPLEKTPPLQQNKLSISRPNDKLLKERLVLSSPKTLGDAKQSGTEITPMLKPKNNFKTAISAMKDVPKIQSLKPIDDTKSRLSSFKSINDSKMRLNKNNRNKLNSAWAFENNKSEEEQLKVIEKPTAKPLVWPKSGDDSFLAKVREAMKARLASFDQTKAQKAVEKVEAAKVQKVESPNTDMMRSASENHDVLLEAPLKESVPYKCRMVCTRE